MGQVNWTAIGVVVSFIGVAVMMAWYVYSALARNRTEQSEERRRIYERIDTQRDAALAREAAMRTELNKRIEDSENSLKGEIGALRTDISGVKDKMARREDVTELGRRIDEAMKLVRPN